MHPDVVFWSSMLDLWTMTHGHRPSVPGREAWYTEELLAAMLRAGC